MDALQMNKFEMYLLQFLRKVRRHSDCFALNSLLIACVALCSGLLATPALALSAPSISPTTGSFATAQSVTISASSGSIFFTTDGSVPSNLSMPYSSAFAITSPTQINAVAYSSGTYSPVTTAYLDVDENLAPILAQPGLVLRLRAGLGVSADAGTPGAVNKWADLSGSGNDLTGAYPYRPSLLNTSINNYPTIGFNGSSEFLTVPSNSVNFSTLTQIAISNSPPIGSGTETITINGTHAANFNVTSSSTNSSIASGLASAINALALSGVSASPVGSIIQVTAPLGTTYSATATQNINILTESAGMTMFVVTAPTSLAPNSRVLDLSDSGVANEFTCQIASTGSNGQLTVNKSGSGSTNVQSASALTQNQFQVLAAVQSSGTSNGTASFFVNGIAGSQNAAMNNIANVTWSKNFLGQSASSGSFYAGQICEVLLYSTALTNSQIAAISAALEVKYQIPSQSPSAPIISVPSGTLPGPTQVTLSCQPGVLTTFTTDGTTPGIGSTPFTGSPITVNYTQTLKAATFKNGLSSSTASASYSLDSTLWPAPNSSDMTTPSLTPVLPTKSQ